MFNKLIASGPGRRSWLRNPTVIFVSVGVHLVALAGIVWASTREPAEAAEPEPEQVTYIDVTEVPPPPDLEEVFEAPPEPEPIQETSPPVRTPTPPQRAPAAPRNPQPSPTPTEEPAGFQELDVPDVDVSGIPEPDLAAPPVRVEDFGGRGTPGGTAAGIPAPPVPASSSRGEGERSGGGGNTTYSAKLVDEQAELLNRGDVARVLVRRYPENLRNAGIEGRVVVQFIVGRNGRVEPGSIRVISSTEQEFVEATRTALQEFRFRPAKKQGQTVRQVVQIPVTWQVNR